MIRPKQARRGGEEAVSPVIGTILMVAITLVLAAVIFVLVQRIDGGDAQTIRVYPVEEEHADDIKFIHVDPGVDANRIQLKMSVAGHLGFNTAAGLATTALPAQVGTPLAPLGTALHGGDKVYLCAIGGASNVTLDVYDLASNSVISQHRFTSLAACA